MKQFINSRAAPHAGLLFLLQQCIRKMSRRGILLDWRDFMAEKYNTILQLAAETEKKVTGSPEEWARFMDTAGRFCKYTFEDQLLIYAQRPDASACAPITVWDRMGCWINRGAKGIALIDTASPRQKLKYVFDMADVTPEREKNGRFPYLWSVKPEHEQAVIDALEAVYGKTDAEYPFAYRVMELLMEAAKGIYEESARRIAPYVEGSLLEGKEWRPFSIRVYGAIVESAHCEVMGACGTGSRPGNYSFHDIKYFNTHETLCMLGNEITAFARPVIAEIGRVVREYERNRETDRTVQAHIEEKNTGKAQKSLASEPESGYNALKRESEAENGKKENSETERGGAYGTGVQTGRGLSDTGYRDGRTAARGAQEIRPAAEEIPDGKQGGRIFDTPAGQQADAAPVQPAGTGRGADGADHSADGGRHGSGRSPQSAGPDALDKKNEQHQALGGGDRPGGDDLHLNNNIQPDAERKEPDNGAAPLSGSFQQKNIDDAYEQLDIFSMLEVQAGGMDAAPVPGGAVPFSKYQMPRRYIDEILRSGGGRDDCRKRIYAKYQQGKTPEEMAAFLRKEYGVTGKGFIFDGKQFAVWFDADGMRIGRGMSAWENTVLSMSWAEIGQNIRSQVENGTYMSASEIYLVDEAERGRIADSLYFFFRNGMGELPEGLGLQAADHPDSHAALVRMLAAPEGIECLAGHMDTALRQLETGEKRLRLLMPKEELREELDNLMVQKLSFPAAESVHIRREDFITQDEIDGRLVHGSGIEGGKFRIYDYFQEGHGAADAAAFLKKEYGDGGSSQGLPGSDNSWEDHNHKGIRMKKGNIHAPYAEILLSWNTVAKHIQRLVSEDKYLSHEGKEAYLEYKKKQKEKEHAKELEKTERETKAACKTAIERTIAEKFDGQRLAEDAAGTVIREYGAERVSYVLANTVTYLKSDGRFSAGNKEWAESIEPYAMLKNSDLVVTSQPAVLDGFIGQARMYIERERAPEQQEKAEESMDAGTALPGTDAQKENGTYYAVSLMPDNSADNYYISLMDGSTGEQIQPYRDSFGKMPAFQTVDEAADYCNRNGIEFQNAPEMDQWHNMETEREKAARHLENKGPEQYKAAVSAVYPGDKNRMPYDTIVEKMRFGQEQDVLEKAVQNDRPAAGNFRITDDALGTGSRKEKFRRNVEAVRTLEKIESESRPATPEEQNILSQYVGWGGLADAFDESKSMWAGKYRELKALLSPEEYTSARESTLNAHYTSPVVIRSIYGALERMGFETGSILEPSMGTGNFFGMLPEKMQGSRLYGVELDGITGRIAKQLYPGADIKITGFEKTSYPNDFFDIAVGNVPFGQYRVPDRQYDKRGFPVHEYFLAKALDKVRPGGVMAFVTSRWVMDKKTTEARKYLAQRAELLGAVRLPNNAFKENAGTEVTADILFFQKLDRMAVKEPEWVYLSENVDGISMNRYFVDHPEMIVGRMEMVSGPYGMESTCQPDTSRPFEEQLKEAVSHIGGSISMMEFSGMEEATAGIPADPDVKNYSYAVVDGSIYYRENSIMLPADVPETTGKRIRGMVQIRDCTQELIRLQMEECPDSGIKEKQAELNALYDNFTKSFGLISSTGNKRAFSQDASYCLLCSLEKLDDEGNFKGKADMFTKRTIKRAEPVTSVETAAEALAVSLSEKARIDLEYMEALCGKDAGEVTKELSGVIFQNPVTKTWETAGEYLSGNVREKLKTAEAYAESHTEYEVNVQALRRVQPKELEASEIDVRIGATWIDMKYIDDFMRDVLQTPQFLLEQGRICTQYSEMSGRWNIKGKNEDRGNTLSGMTYGTGRANAYRILEDSLNLKDVRIYDMTTDEEGREKRVLNKKETMLAAQKQEALREAFRTWVFEEPKRRQELCAEYNRLFNSVRPREYDGSHLKFPGMTPDIELQPHQLNAVAHQLYGANTLLAHCVGAGKTFEMIAAAMEARRLGISQKCMFVVPNHLTGQWAADFLRLYPGANILAATKKDFETANRKKFCSRIATGEYDAVIIGHSQFAMIPLSAERQAVMIERQIDEIEASIAEAKAEKGERYTVKQMEATKKSLYARLERLNDAERKDNVVTFEQLGVDRLFVDESHSFKNLFLYTKMRNVAGIAQSEAQKSSDMFAKCQYMDELTGGKGITFATGTPISNSMTEMYTNMRYLQYNTLQRLGFGQFDAWASTFGETVTAVELAPEGTGYRTKTRFSKFYNLPELMSIFKQCADIQTADMLKLPVPEVQYENVVLKPSEYQKEIVQSLAERAEAVRNKEVEPHQDNMLKITNEGRKLALDQRLVNDMLPDNESSKAAACVENAYKIWESTKAQRSAQLFFCDLSTPKGDGTFNVYEDIRDRLVKKGVPEGEVAFIHSANTEARKAELFAKVRSGQVRFLLGSTQKMGAGTNVQDRLIALHHLDIPWRPADIEQQEGRILRQGNENKKVFIFRYITENTFDSYSWQLIENKQKFISQVMTGKSPVRSCEDIDESVLSYAEVKALATGNPHIKEKMTLDVEVAKLKMMKANFAGQKYKIEDNITVHYPKKIAALESKVEGYRTDIQTYIQNRPADKELFSMKVGNTEYHSRKEAGTALIGMCRNISGVYQQAAVGEYQGFKMSASYTMLSTVCTIHLEGSLCHESEASADPFGIIQRLDNVLEAMPKELQKLQQELDNVQRQLETARHEVDKPFEKEQELREKSDRLAELNALLDTEKNEETGNPGHDGEQGEPEIRQPDSMETGRKTEDDTGRRENGAGQGIPENREPYQESDKPLLGVAEPAGYGRAPREADMEMHRPAGRGQEKTETVKQPDVRVQMHGSANAVEKEGEKPQPTDGKMTPGCMQVRTSVRERLAAIRERRAAEQAQGQVQKPQIKKDRAAAL